MNKPMMSQPELDRLAGVVGEAELKTSGEIRLMIVKRSTAAGHVGPLLWLVFTSVALMIMWFERSQLDSYSWLVPVVLVAAAVVSFPLSRWWRVQRLFITPGEMSHAAQVRAELEFHREGLSATSGSTGILLFLTLFERQAVVLADKGIASRLPASTWDDVVKVILDGARSEKWESKLSEAIRLCGEHLSKHFPIQPGDVNELPNAVIVKE